MTLPCLIATLALGACAAPAPVLYSNAHLRSVGSAQAEGDIAECRQLASDAGATDGAGAVGHAAAGTVHGGALGAASGALGGAMHGAAGRGAMVGAAVGATVGFLRGVFRPAYPSRAHVAYVNRCLSDRGYETVGWQ
jgi:hypothetical protein